VNAPEVDLLSSRGSASLGDDSTNYLTKEGLRQVGLDPLTSLYRSVFDADTFLQAQEAGEKLRSSRNLLSGSQNSSFVLPSPSPSQTAPFVGRFGGRFANECPAEEQSKSPFAYVGRAPRQDEHPGGGEPSAFIPSAGLSPSAGDSPEPEAKPLISSFEAELAKLMSETFSETIQKPELSSAAPQESSSQSGQGSSSSEELPSRHSTIPGEALAQTLHAVLSGLGSLTADLKDRLPVVERRLADLQDDIPVRVESGVNHALHGLTDHVQILANVMQDTVTAVSHAAESTRRGDILARPEVDSLRNLAHDLAETGKALFAPFKHGSAAPPTDSQAPPDQPSSAGPSNVAEPETEVQGPPPSLGGAVNNVAAASPTAPLHATTPTSKTTLFVGNLLSDVTEKKLEDAFAAQGFLGKASLPTNAVTGKHAGFGYVQFPSTYAASGAIQALQGTYLNGRAINLEFSYVPVGESSEAPAELPPSVHDQADEARYELQGAQTQPTNPPPTRLHSLLRTYLDMDTTPQPTAAATTATDSANKGKAPLAADPSTESDQKTTASPGRTEKARIRRQVEGKPDPVATRPSPQVVLFCGVLANHSKFSVDHSLPAPEASP
jgi:RNA recognition motif-containing protein